MIQTPKATFLIQSEILATLKQTGIRQTSPGGKARAFCDIVGDQIGQLETRAYLNLAQTLLPYASGDNLDFLGQIYGVARIPRQDVVSTPGEQNFQFYVRTGTFGTINGGQDITVPADTKIFTHSDTGPVFLLDEAVTLPANTASRYFQASAYGPGAAGNAAAGVFTRHNFSSYRDSRFGTLLVTNSYGLIGGRDQEADDSYRYRINLHLQSHGGAAESDLRFAILQIPGIQDVVFESQAGTFTVYVYAINPVPTPGLIQLVQSEIDQRSAYPMVGLASAPDLIGVSLSTSLKLSSSVASADQPTILANAAAAAENYLNNLAIGRQLVINEVSDAILKSDPRILDLGQPNRPLEEIFLWRSRADDTRYSRYLVTNYTPGTGERLVVESTPNAINLSVA